jgi:hypothetical protein
MRETGGGSGEETVYSGECACGARKKLVFAPIAREGLWDDPLGEGVSTVLDPGQLMLAYERYIAEIPVDVRGRSLVARQRAQIYLGRALAALEEILKFIPARDTEVPASAFKDPRGRGKLEELPGQFRRNRLQARIDEHRRQLLDLNDLIAAERTKGMRA